MSLNLTKTTLSLSMGLALCSLYIPLSSAATFVIEKNEQSFSIDGNNGEQEGQQLYLWSTDSSNENQHWVQIDQGDGFYSYRKLDTNLCWDGGDGGSKRQAVTLEECDSEDMNQHWEKIKVISNTQIYRFEKRNASDYSIDGNGGGENGQSLYLWTSSDTNVNQQWELTNLNDTSTDNSIDLDSNDGIDSSTGYAENYSVTGNEMTLELDNVSWNTVTVDTASELESALENASAGDKIVIAAGTYIGNFKLEKSGTQNKPIWLVGESASNMPVIDGDDYNNNTGLAIDGEDAGGVSYIYIQDIEVTNAKTGISVDQADYVTIDNVEVYDVGQSAIHLRDGSEYNIVKNSYIHDTGLYNVKYGEGIYIGSDYTKWPGGSSSSEYDPAVDHAQILNNTIGPNVTAEHIDIKEGSSNAYVIGNTFNAKGMIDIINGGLSFIDFKGNNAEAAYNIGDQNDNEYFENAFEINEKSNGWGAYNNIHNNKLTFDDEYYDNSSVSITITLALGSGGESNSVETTDDIKPTHWVVKNNVGASNTVSDNTRVAEDEDKMYTGF